MRDINDLDKRIVNESACSAKSRNTYKRLVSIAACLVLIAAIMLLSSCSYEDDGNAPPEVALILNDSAYSVVYPKESPAYDNFDLEEEITSAMIGEYLGECTENNEEEKEETFKMYRYTNCPVTQYDWMPRIIAEDSDGDYYHALGWSFDETKQTSEEILTVYGISSSKSIVSIENKGGKKVTDRAFIDAFYNGLFTSEYGGNDFLQENVYQNTGIDESEIDKLYTKHADAMVYLKAILSNGLVIDVDFTTHNFVEAGNGLYFKVDDEWLDLVSIFKE